MSDDWRGQLTGTHLDRAWLETLTEDQRWAIRRLFIDYLKTARLHAYEPIANWANAEAEVWHSALLARLLNGKLPTEEKPPLKHAYPDYEAVKE